MLCGYVNIMSNKESGCISKNLMTDDRSLVRSFIYIKKKGPKMDHPETLASIGNYIEG